MAEEALKNLSEEETSRRAKLVELRKQGYCYPNDFKRSHLAQELLDKYSDGDAEKLHYDLVSVQIAGRMMSRRVMGKASFFHLQDMSGQIQIYLRKDEVGEEYGQFLTWDRGDIIGVRGTVFKTKTGELSVRAQHLKLLTKAVMPLPEKFHGLTDQETRYRQRYVDLIMNPQVRKIFRVRFALIAEIRQFLMRHNFVEVETPMMQPIPGGATARPFITHHNALDMELYLRIAPELYLKRLVVGGFERIFELNRNFRNEGISVRHNPEFTMVEFYQAYATYHDLMDFTEEMLRYLAKQVLGYTIITYQGLEIDLMQSFTRLTMQEAILKYNPELKAVDLSDQTKLETYAKKLNLAIPMGSGLGRIQTVIFEETVEHELKQPTFITRYPAEVSPLARPSDDDPFFTDRFEFFVTGKELANGFSELNDPERQARTFRQQAENLAKGDDEAMHYDADYVTALEYGLPPTAGEGIGIDRLAMLFADVPSIREVILFPLLRRQRGN